MSLIYVIEKIPTFRFSSQQQWILKIAVIAVGFVSSKKRSIAAVDLIFCI